MFEIIKIIRPRGIKRTHTTLSVTEILLVLARVTGTVFPQRYESRTSATVFKRQLKTFLFRKMTLCSICAIEIILLTNRLTVRFV